MKKALLTVLALILFVIQAGAANVIQLTISPSDLAQYREKSEKFQFTDAQFQLNNGANSPLIEMETRGQGSIHFKRRNFGLKLNEKISVGRVTSNKINLLSMSADLGYISTRLGLLTAELLQIGKPLPTEYSEVFINGRTQGLYTIVEKPKSALDKSPYVVRRGYKSRFTTAEAEISKKLSLDQIAEIETVASSIYEAVASKSGQDLFTHLRQVMDIDAYMRWMVMNSLYMNGDFPDEIFFYVDSEMFKQGRIFFRVMPWDFDDLFKPMHKVKTNYFEAQKIENKDSILYSYEDKLDRAFSPANVFMYEQLKTTARQVLTERLNQANTDQLLGQIFSELSTYTRKSQILKMGSQDSGRKGLAYNQEEIADLFANRKKLIDQRRIYLLERIK